MQWWAVSHSSIVSYSLDRDIIPAIMITRLYAMYQKSRKILILLVSIYSAVTISCVVIISIWSRTYQLGELDLQVKDTLLIQQISEASVLSGQYICLTVALVDTLLLATTWILGTVWEVLTLSLAVWIAIKHFRELPTGWTIEDCFKVLIRSHVLYFAS